MPHSDVSGLAKLGYADDLYQLTTVYSHQQSIELVALFMLHNYQKQSAKRYIIWDRGQPVHLLVDSGDHFEWFT